jgi:hypothetical protein
MDLWEIGSDGGRWMELAEDWQALMLLVLDLKVLLPEH